MTRILISGCLGHMGRVTASTIESRNDCETVAGLDISSDDSTAFPVFKNLDELNTEIDVIVDFSNPVALKSLLAYAVRTGTPLILCTTGYSTSQEKDIKEASLSAPIFYSGNMSLGINLLIELSKKAAAVFGEGFDIEIIEKHHNQKLDAPSGTAIMIADAVSKSQGNRFGYVYDRHSVRKKRGKNELGIHSLRAGTIVGEHEIVFAGNDETLTITHQALSKQIFATGAVNAAVFMLGKPAGIYRMSDLLA